MIRKYFDAYTEWRDRLPFFIHTIIACIEIILVVLLAAGAFFAAISPILLSGYLLGENGYGLGMVAYAFFWVGAGLVRDRRRAAKWKEKK